MVIDGTTVKKKDEKNQCRRPGGETVSFGQAFPSPDILSRRKPPPPEKKGWRR
jgi:hypothetical protein